MADEKDLSGLDIFTNSNHRFKNTLRNFKLLHELCWESKIFSKEMLYKLELLAREFKNMGSQSSAIAKLTFNFWVDEVIEFYTYILKGGSNKERIKYNLGMRLNDLATVSILLQNGSPT